MPALRDTSIVAGLLPVMKVDANGLGAVELGYEPASQFSRRHSRQQQKSSRTPTPPQPSGLMTPRDVRTGISRKGSGTSSGYGVGLALGAWSSGMGQLLTHQATCSNSRAAPYRTPLSTLTANAMHLPLTASAMRQLQQEQLQQTQQQIHLQAQIQQQVAQAQQELLRRREERRNNKAKTHRRHRRSGGERTRAEEEATRITMDSDDYGSAAAYGAAARRRYFFCFDEFGNPEFSAQFVRRFHWVSQVWFLIHHIAPLLHIAPFFQMAFFFGFVLFCLFFFLIYPNSRLSLTDPACLLENAEWFASIPT